MPYEKGNEMPSTSRQYVSVSIDWKRVLWQKCYNCGKKRVFWASEHFVCLSCKNPGAGAAYKPRMYKLPNEIKKKWK